MFHKTRSLFLPNTSSVNGGELIMIMKMMLLMNGTKIMIIAMIMVMIITG